MHAMGQNGNSKETDTFGMVFSVLEFWIRCFTQNLVWTVSCREFRRDCTHAVPTFFVRDPLSVLLSVPVFEPGAEKLCRKKEKKSVG